ncbi:dual specificity protein phosphatase family protein [Sphingosinicella sp. BN140058]|uniref:phosphatase domain-containing putative toxin n=1 Tax=Sphingosinicella sp. BN140058 TaxID=1892855 RepID=UPI00101070A0|nr:dual specificity protein phosphatase family protein [Sphingosinicella sp. BN140058]QAY76359.1 tyrosine protein phosphatase [Sphingosinicella sp. BN140058]
MRSEIYWIDTKSGPKLAIMARPRAGDWLEDEIAHWKDAGVERVVSLLEQNEIEELELGAEARLCARSGIDFVSFPIADRHVPDDMPEALALAWRLAVSGKRIAIHCRAGIGRSSVMAAAVLVAAGITPEAALAAITAARGVEVPDTEAQRQWVLRLGGATFLKLRRCPGDRLTHLVRSASFSSGPKYYFGTSPYASPWVSMRAAAIASCGVLPAHRTNWNTG